MQLLVKRTANGRTQKEIGEISINKTTITVSHNTLDVYGLKNQTYLGIGKRENGMLIAVFTSDKNLGLLKLTNGSSRSMTKSISLAEENRKQLRRYMGNYMLREKVDLMKNAVCYTLTPKQN